MRHDATRPLFGTPAPSAAPAAQAQPGDGLEIQALAVTYGQHRALKGVSLRVAPGEIVVILGANGAGKTSLLKAVGGMIRSEPGSQVRLDGHALSGLPPHRIVEAGLALVPEGRGIFGDLSVHENLMLGAFAQRARADQADNLQRVLSLFGRLAERRTQLARTMSGGEQQMVAIGRALMSAPRILMLDEPSLGLSPLLCTELFRNLKRVRDTGVGILLVEQNARQSLAIADRAYLLENGEIVGQGPAEQLARDPAVQAAYLGGAAGHGAGHAPAPRSVGMPTTATRETLPMTAPPSPIRPAAAPQASVSADALVPQRIADLVRVAAQRQAEEVAAQRAQSPGGGEGMAGAMPSWPSSGTLQDALGRIEQAAARARIAPSASATSTTSTTSAAPPPASPRPATAPATPPTLEVWRRPGLEIFRRQPDGSMKKEP